MLEHLASAAWPTSRADGADWRPEDHERKAKAGTTLMSMSAALLYVKGDWAEYATTFGFPGWQSVSRPCLFCATSKARMFEVVGLSPISFPHRETTSADVEQAAARCELTIVITEALRERILPFLRYDKRKEGSHGRALTRDIAGTALRAKDRLEPSAELPDVGAFETATCPFTATAFAHWSPKISLPQESFVECRNRCPAHRMHYSG